MMVVTALDFKFLLLRMKWTRRYDTGSMWSGVVAVAWVDSTATGSDEIVLGLLVPAPKKQIHSDLFNQILLLTTTALN